MDREEALAQIRAGKAFERLQAARFFQRAATAADRPALLSALRRERDRWVKNALRHAIVRSGPDESPIAGTSLGRDQEYKDLIEDVRMRVTEEVAKLLIHEIRPIVGAAKLDAEQEVLTYATSRTRASLERLSSLLEALAELSQAASAPADKEFDLAELIENLTKRQEFAGTEIELAGPGPLLVVGDPARVDMVLSNGLRNAIEATTAIESDEPIVVNWDRTDVAVWVAIVDGGIGLTSGADRAFDVGTTSKPKEEHFGIGLAIAKRAASSMDGEIGLSPREEGGTRLEFRWPGIA